TDLVRMHLADCLLRRAGVAVHRFGPSGRVIAPSDLTRARAALDELAAEIDGRGAREEMATIGKLSLVISANSEALKSDLGKSANDIESFASQSITTLKGVTLKLAGGANPFQALYDSAKGLTGLLPGPAGKAMSGLTEGLEAAGGKIADKWSEAL